MRMKRSERHGIRLWGPKAPRHLGTALVAALCLAAAACGSSSSSSPTSASASATTSATSAATTSAATTSAGASSKTPINVAMVSWKIAGDDELTPLTAGAEAAVKSVNASGGIFGRPLVLNTCNDMLAAGPATECAHETIAQHPIAMIGCSLAWGSTGLPVYEAAKVPSLSCLNVRPDVADPWDFGITPSAIGQDGAAAQYFCTLPDAHTIGFLSLAGTGTNIWLAQYAYPVLKACGKTWVSIYEPLTTIDQAPYVAKVMAGKPQYILSSVQIPQTPGVFSAFAQAGMPASHILAADVNFTQQILSKAPSMKGGIALLQFQPWTLTSNADVAAYQKALQGSSVNPNDPTVQWGYSLATWLAKSLQHLGAANINSVALQQYWTTANNIPIPLTRLYTNPGPTSAPQIKQPYVRLAQWTGSTFNPLPVGPAKDGWIRGLP